ncbi:hypothetical protein L195_g063824, partial [Trifolium pratense]
MNVAVVDDTVVENVHVSSSKVVGSDTLSSLTKVVVESPKETSHTSNVISDVETSWTNPLVLLKPVLQ